MTAIVDIHILQTVPPSNVNRDDTGSPKTAVYGGTIRARISSQALKRATRKAFESRFDTQDLGVRTKRVVELVTDEVKRLDPSRAEEALTLAESILTAAEIKLTAPKVKKGDDTPPKESGYLIFLSRRQVTKLAELALESADPTKEKKAAKAAINDAHSVDVALFGRMVADDAELNVDAAAQVAHALSVHKVANEFDYFTAVDDLKEDAAETGAGMIGTVEFNSSTLYRYATVNVEALHQSLGDSAATVRAVSEFVRAFITSMPTGKQNTFANRTLPDAVVVQVRTSQPVNLVGAFENAVVAGEDQARLAVTAQRLTQHATRIDNAYGTAPVAAFVVTTSDSTASLEDLGTPGSLDSLLTGLAGELAGRLS